MVGGRTMLRWRLVVGFAAFIFALGASCDGDDDPTPLPLPTDTGSDTVPVDMTQQEREEKVLDDARGLQLLLNDFWTQELARLYNIQFDVPDRFEFYRGEGNQPCGGIPKPLPNNAYYCNPDSDEYVAFDLDWLQAYLVDYPGGATTFLILAHEWGHAVQDTWLETGGTDVWNPPARKELNADCLAGVFLAEAIADGSITEEAGDSEAIWGWLYSQGGPWFAPTDHGTQDERIAAFADGVAAGTDQCRQQY